MSRTRKAVITAAVFIVAGVITVLTALAVNGFRWPSVNVNLANMTSEPINYTKKTTDIEDSFSTIDIESASDVDIAVKKADGATSYVEYYDSDELTHSVDVSDGVLKITAEDHRNNAYKVSIGFYTGNWPRVTVYLADTAYDNLKISTGSGNVDMEYYLAIGNIDIEASSGDVCVKGTNADSLTIATSSGEISIDSAAVENASISASSGDVDLNDTVISDSIELKTSSGDITSDGMKAKHISCHANSGDISFYKSDAVLYDVITTSGDVSIDIDSNKKYVFDTKTSSGDVDVPDSYNDAEGTCNIKTSSGDISVTE